MHIQSAASTHAGRTAVELLCLDAAPMYLSAPEPAFSLRLPAHNPTCFSLVMPHSNKSRVPSHAIARAKKIMLVLFHYTVEILTDCYKQHKC